jgi:RHS repeat-associated protein
VPKTSVTSKYAWNGSSQEPTELSTGIINMGARGYVPQLGRFEQTDPQPGGSINSYAYTTDDPVNQTDPSGAEWVYNTEAFQAGPGAALPETVNGPGAITPAEVEQQAEAAIAADEPPTAMDTFYDYQESAGGSLGLVDRFGTLENSPQGGNGGGVRRTSHSGGLVVIQAVVGLVHKVEHFVHKVEHDVSSHAPKCYPTEIQGGTQCSSAPPGDGGDNPFSPIYEP